MTQSTTNTRFLKLAYHEILIKNNWDFILLLLSQNLYGITHFLRISELKGRLVIKLVHLFPNEKYLNILIQVPGPVPFIPVESQPLSQELEVFSFSTGILEDSGHWFGVITNLFSLLQERKTDLMCLVIELDNRTKNPLLLIY